MKIPQVTPDWETGIFIGNGTIATKRGNKMSKKYIVDLTSVSDQSEETKTLLENATNEEVAKWIIGQVKDGNIHIDMIVEEDK